MKISQVSDLDLEDVGEKTFDIFIAFCGYEGRATYLAKKFHNVVRAHRKVSLEYSPDLEVLNKKRNREKLGKLGFDTIKIAPGTERDVISSLLASESLSAERPLRILIDYSSMRRTLYLEVLNSFIFDLVLSREVEIVFSYTLGRYVGKHAAKYVEGHETLPGLDGRTSQKREKLVILNLGYEPISALTMLEAIEPDRVIGVLASPGVSKISASRCKKLNKTIIDEQLDDDLVRLPIRSVEKYCRYMLENIGRLTGAYDIVFVPYGPKPLVLGSILSCLTRSEWTNLYIRGMESKPVDVASVGECVFTKVELKSDPRELVDFREGISNERS